MIVQRIKLVTVRDLVPGLTLVDENGRETRYLVGTGPGSQRGKRKLVTLDRRRNDEAEWAENNLEQEYYVTDTMRPGLLDQVPGRWIQGEFDDLDSVSTTIDADETSVADEFLEELERA